MFKRLILIIIIQSLIFSPLLFTPKKVEAQGLGGVVTDWLANLGIYTSVTQSAASAADAQRAITVPVFDVVQYSQLRVVETAKAAKETKDNIIQTLFSIFLEALRRRLLDMIVDEIITWIQGGGNPQFVSNWQNFLEDAANAAVGDVILQTNAAFLCSPFKLQVQLALLPVPKFSKRIECTLDDIVANIEDFYEDFENGGWIAYRESWQPQNNYYGQLIMINDEKTYQAAARQQAIQDEALAGKGFLSVKRCKGGGFSVTQIGQIEYHAPGSTGSYVRDSKGNYCLPSEMEDITPGVVVGEMVSKAVGVDIDYILTAKELEQYVAAITNAVINRVVKEGVGLIKGSSEYEQDITPYTQPYEDGLTQIQSQEKARIIAEYQNVLDDRNAILGDKNNSLPSAEQIVVVLKKIQQKGCQPPVYQTDVDKAESEVNRLKTEIENLQKLISEIEILKAEAEAISPDYRLREMDILNANYTEFLGEYDDIILEVYSGSAQKAAEEESQQKRDDLFDYQTRLISCI